MVLRSLAVVACVLSTSFLVGCAADDSRDIVQDSSNVKTAKPRTRFVCREWDRKTEKLKQRTAILQQTDDQGLTEGKKLAFDFELYTGADVVAEREAKGTVETEDVNVSFQSADGKVGFHIFLDEMEEAGLTLDGKDGGDFHCTTGHLVCHDYDRKTDELGQRTAVLTPKGDAPVVEGKKIPFDLESFTGIDTFHATSVKGTVETEDVMFNFTSTDGKTTFHHFMDEINESGMTVDGKDAGDFICR